MNSGIIALLLFAGFSYVLTAAPTYPGRPNYDNIPQCMQPPEAGLCLAYIPSFYYNPATKKCQSFVYGGCQGNKNRFFSEDECMKKCGNQSVEENTVQEQNPAKEDIVTDICSLPSEAGLCYALFHRFYFNGEKCEEFTYGGCGGNKNNFDTEEECIKACPPKAKES